MPRMVTGLGLLLIAANAAAADIPKVLPGEWESTSTVHMQSMPDLPPQVAEMMRQQQAKGTVIRYCVTPEQAARGPAESMAKAHCSMQNVSYSAGHMSAETVCNSAGREIRNTVSGSYSPVSYSLDGAMTSSGGRGGGMAMTMHIEGRRLSAVCTSRPMDVQMSRPQ